MTSAFRPVLRKFSKFSRDAVAASDICVVSAARTPIGSFQGALASLTAPQLGSAAIRGALARLSLDASLVNEVYMGNVLSAGLGQAPSRQAVLGAGLPQSVACTDVNKVCASGMKAVMLASQSIQLGVSKLAVAGGMESMSNAPYYLAKARGGYRLGHGELIDGLVHDGLWDPYSNSHMGSCAELCAKTMGISREQQDDHALQSFARARAASEACLFEEELVPVEVPGGRGRAPSTVEQDEALGTMDSAKLLQLKPVFQSAADGGTITAGNASSISDGAAALVLASGDAAMDLDLEVMARVRGYADAAQAPEWFTTAPSLAIPKALAHAGLEARDVDFYEINEAFSVVDLANQQILGLSPDRYVSDPNPTHLEPPIKQRQLSAKPCHGAHHTRKRPQPGGYVPCAGCF